MLSFLKQSKLFLNFSKWSRPPPIPRDQKMKAKGRAISDEKSAKISQAEQEENQKKVQENLKKQQELLEALKTRPKMKTWDSFYDEHIGFNELHKLKHIRFPIYYKKNVRQKPVPPPQIVALNQEVEGQRRLHNKVPVTFGDVSAQVNANLIQTLKQHNYESQPLAQPKRCGAIGIKVGMTSVWDKWGKKYALTVIQLDRNQVIHVKTKEHDGIDALQIGAGEANVKTLTKPMIGHFMKNNIPPKKHICEFPITAENTLPIGYMITARHFVPGQFLDVAGINNGKGFSGTIKRWNFRRQPASHGCSLSHRIAGSTGMRTDPGRVFKGHKMAGRLGAEPQTIEGIQIYKIDAERQLIFVKGSIPGRAGNPVYLRDSYRRAYKNEEILNYPTLVPQQGQKLSKQISIPPPEEDPLQQELHENDVIEGEEEG